MVVWIDWNKAEIVRTLLGQSVLVKWIQIWNRIVDIIYPKSKIDLRKNRHRKRERCTL